MADRRRKSGPTARPPIQLNPDLSMSMFASRAGPDGFGSWVLMLLWAAGFDTTVVPRAMGHLVGATDETFDKLERAGLIRKVRGGDYVLESPLVPPRFKPAWTLLRSRTHISPEVREFVMARDGYRCVLCGTKENLTLDHIYPWSKGGPDTEDNLRVLCRSCNSTKRDRVNG
jgi:hypothetical protein